MPPGQLAYTKENRFNKRTPTYAAITMAAKLTSTAGPPVKFGKMTDELMSTIKNVVTVVASASIQAPTCFMAVLHWQCTPCTYMGLPARVYYNILYCLRTDTK